MNTTLAALLALVAAFGAVWHLLAADSVGQIVWGGFTLLVVIASLACWQPPPTEPDADEDLDW